jgi:hypothetical protein
MQIFYFIGISLVDLLRLRPEDFRNRRIEYPTFSAISLKFLAIPTLISSETAFINLSASILLYLFSLYIKKISFYSCKNQEFLFTSLKNQRKNCIISYLTSKERKKVLLNKENMNKSVKLPIAPALKGLDKYKSTEFPLSQMQSVRSTIQALCTEFADNNLRFTTKKNKETKMLEVTRIA